MCTRYLYNYYRRDSNNFTFNLETNRTLTARTTWRQRRGFTELVTTWNYDCPWESLAVDFISVQTRPRPRPQQLEPACASDAAIGAKCSIKRVNQAGAQNSGLRTPRHTNIGAKYGA